ncbi:MAG: trehalose utilization protein ThuA, partial [Clostridia bacterium]|nr:trehalose utilization protein ThuA [Clostridia bacterium]
MAIRITVWNEDNVQESSADVLKVYPEGLVGAVADMFKGEQFQVRKAWLSQEEAGLTEEILADTDVLIWWGHCK